MWLVLCSSSDASAHWAFQGLKQLGIAPLHLLTAESLASAHTWEHRLDDKGAQVKITLANGQVIQSSRVRGVLNRLLVPCDFTAQSAVPADRVYAQTEMQAFYLSWLHAMPGVVINRPDPLGLCGRWMHASEWTLRAGRAGLRTCVYRQSSRDLAPESGPARCRSLSRERSSSQSLISLRGEIFGAALPVHVAQACGKLADAAETEMLGIQLNSDERNDWVFADANPLPDLRVGGAPLLWRMAQILLKGERR